MAKTRTYAQQQAKRKRKKEKTKVEFSKKIFYMLSIMIVCIVTYSMVLMWHIGDASPLTYLIPAAFGAYSVGIGFYYDKAKKENLSKFNIAIQEGTESTVSYEDDSDLKDKEGAEVSG